MNNVHALAILGVLALAPPQMAVADRPSATESSLRQSAPGKRISTLYLFVHPMPRRAPIREEFMAKWEKLFAAEGPKEENAICVLSNAPQEMEVLRAMAKKYFGQRCIIDPSDNSIDTRLILVSDLERSLSGRGNYSEWVPYEIWTSNNARRWAEGFKRELRSRGLHYDPTSLQVVSCGQQWTGCLTKYSNFFTKYLGVTRPVQVRPELSPEAGFPLEAVFREAIAMDRNVGLFLFETADGRPMAQFLDCLRGVWEAPHAAIVPVSAANVEITITTPNLYQEARHLHESSKLFPQGVVVDVGDGCRPVIATVVGKDISYSDFRASFVKARIVPLLRTASVRTSNLPVGCSDTLRPDPDK
ncbi:MAG: hypothetical protein GX575_06420 [Candidatus Anammoximicrobium sp.]|nr:hypothetical protein [Candidatus Anammoximicrobium sp.]